MSDLVISDLTVRFRRGHNSTVAVDGVNLRLPAGKTLGLVGESGSGKSSIGRAIVGLNAIDSGSITLGGVDITQRSAHRERTAIQMVFQDPRSSLNPRMSIQRTLLEALSLSDRAAGRSQGTAATRRARARELLATVSLPEDYLESFPRQLSGGQRQRVALARALAREPDVVIADEVTSALDVSVQAAILDLLVRLQKERGISLLFISHNLAVVRYLSDDVAVMRGGRLIEHGPAQQVLEHPKEEYTRTLRSAVLDVDIDRRTQGSPRG